MNLINRKESLFSFGFHFGVRLKRWRPLNSNYVMGVRRKDVVYFAIDKVSFLLRRSLFFISSLGHLGLRNLLFVEPGVNRSFERFCSFFNRFLGMDYSFLSLSFRWPSGYLTNYIMTVRKIRASLVKFLVNLPFSYLYIVSFPMVGIIGSIERSLSALLEMNLVNVPVVALVSSDLNYEGSYITYPVPGNNVGISSRLFFYKLLLYTWLESFLKRKRRYKKRTLFGIKKRHNQRKGIA